jgi:hypothetical protein
MKKSNQKANQRSFIKRSLMDDAAKLTNNKISKYFERTKNNDNNEVVIIENDDETSSLKLSDESDSSDSESMEAISINDKKEIEEVIQELSNGPSNISKSLQFEKENKHAKFKYLQHLSIQRYLQLLLDGSKKMAESPQQCS